MLLDVAGDYNSICNRFIVSMYWKIIVKWRRECKNKSTQLTSIFNLIIIIIYFFVIYPLDRKPQDPRSDGRSLGPVDSSAISTHSFTDRRLNFVLADRIKRWIFVQCTPECKPGGVTVTKCRQAIPEQWRPTVFHCDGTKSVGQMQTKTVSPIWLDIKLIISMTKCQDYLLSRRGCTVF